MYELVHSEYQQVRPLFEDLTHSRALVFSLLESNHLGRVFVGRAESPTAAFLALACEFWYVGGDAGNQAFLREIRHRILPELLPSGGPLFLFPADAAWQQALQAALADLQTMVIARSEFALDEARFAAQGACQEHIPAGFSVQRYDRALAAGLELEPFWGGLDRFLEGGFGFAVLRGDEVVSRCHTVMVGDGRAEIGVETSEPYRRQGLGALAASALIQHGLARGIRPAWSCWSINTPSLRMAHKLGFVPHAAISVLYSPHIQTR